MNEKNSNEPNIGAVLNEKDKNKQKEMYLSTSMLII